MCVLSSIGGVALAHGDINIFTQIGFVVLVGLAGKNAILIVEFAKIKRDEGASLRDAALEACRLRLRPILMTSFAFILGVYPLVSATGAGAEMRQALGTAVFSGMLGVTLFGILLTPVFFYTVEGLAEHRWFASGRLAQVGRFGIDLLRLRPLFALGRGLTSWAGRRSARRSAARARPLADDSPPPPDPTPPPSS
jgi:multidrug efflux pump